MNARLFFLVLKQEALTLKSALLIIFLSLIFISASFIVINYQTYLSFLLSNYSLFSKIKIISLIFLGSFQATSTADLLLIVVMGFLFGLNLTLVINKFKLLKRRGNVRIMFGTGVVSLVAAGCASCGLSFASLIGISAVLALLPFGGVELYIFAIGILLISLYFNIKQIAKVCKIT